MCAERRQTPDLQDDWPADPAQTPAGPLLLSGRLAVLRTGHHLADIAERLRVLEAILIEEDSADAPTVDRLRRARRTRLQAMDLILQELTGLSDLLVHLSEHASDRPDPAVDALVDLPRLESLAQALRATGGSDTTPPSAAGIVLF